MPHFRVEVDGPWGDGAAGEVVPYGFLILAPSAGAACDAASQLLMPWARQAGLNGTRPKLRCVPVGEPAPAAPAP